MNERGNILTFHKLREKYFCEYPIFYSIIKLLAECSVNITKSFFTRTDNIFSLNETTQINLYKAKSRDFFYNLLTVKILIDKQMGPKRWSEKLPLKKDVGTKIFKLLRSICKETKLKECQFKLIHRTIVTKKGLFRFSIKADDECLYCGDKDSIDLFSLGCLFSHFRLCDILQRIVLLSI